MPPAPIVLVALVLLFGCGPGLSVSLPNDHTLMDDSICVTIVSEHHDGARVKHTISSLDTDGPYVFGKIADPDSQLFMEYFVLDTTTSHAEYYPSREPWTEFLHAVGVTEIHLRGPSAFFNYPDQLWWRVVLLAIALPIITVPPLLIRRAKRRSLEARRLPY